MPPYAAKRGKPADEPENQGVQGVAGERG